MHPLSEKPSHDIRGLIPDDAMLRIPEETKPGEGEWIEVVNGAKPGEGFWGHYRSIGVAEHEFKGVLAALRECRGVFKSIRREWHWSFLIAKHLWAAECEAAGGYVPKSHLPQDPTHYMPALVMFRDGRDALEFALEMLVLENLFLEFQFKWHIIRVPAGHNPLCLWADYFAQPDAEWVEFAEIPEGPAYRLHRLLANIGYRLCEESPAAECQLPVHNLASIFFGSDIPTTAKRITRIRQFLIAWGVLIETEPAVHAKRKATTFRVCTPKGVEPATSPLS